MTTEKSDSVVVIFLWGILGAIGTFGWQLYTYLKAGAWHSLSIITAMRWFGIEWALTPSDWFGIYKILDAFPLSLFYFVLGLAVVGVAVVLGLFEK